MLLSETEIWFRDWCEELVKLNYIESFSYETNKFDLSNSVQLKEYLYKIKKATKKNKESISQIEKDSTLLESTSLTADFTINWTHIGKLLFCKELQYLEESDLLKCYHYAGSTDFEQNMKSLNYFYCVNSISYIEIKPHYEGKNINSSIEFPIKQKWVWSKYKAFIQKIKPVGDLKKSIKYWHQLGQDNSTTKLKMPNSLFDLTFYPNSFFYTPTGKIKHNKEFDIDLIDMLPTLLKWKK